MIAKFSSESEKTPQQNKSSKRKATPAKASSPSRAKRSVKKTKSTTESLLAQKLAQSARQIDESEKIPFSEVGTEINVVVPPPMLKPITPVVKIRNRSPLPMPDASSDTQLTDDASE